MAEQKKRIYITPKSGILSNLLLVLDHVETMSHLSTATVASHPVEGQNQNKSDHRYHNGKVINLTGMISENWKVDVAQTNPTPVFKSLYAIESNRLRRVVKESAGEDAWVTIYVNEILDGFGDPTDEEIATNVPTSQQFYITQARRIVVSEKDMVQEAADIGLSTDKSESNVAIVNGGSNPIQASQEFLKYIDSNDTIVTIQSLYDIYDNMVLTNFNQVLRNGPQRGAYWVNLSFREERITNSVDKFLSADPESSEELTTRKGGGKKFSRTADASDAQVKKVDDLYVEFLETARSEESRIDSWLQVNPNNVPTIKERALSTYMASGNNIASTNGSFQLNFRTVINSRGKTSW
ncbi:MAG: hypothetical protein HRU21_10600 [Pseudomonadales bacterium]|nr:hypothetical protein [Pseudomonadales bacterium]